MPSAKRLILLVGLAAGLSVAWPADTSAQVRGGRGRVVARQVVVARPYYFYDPFWYDPFWYGPPYFAAQWGYPPYGGYPPYRYYAMDPGASMKLEVKPNQAEVYVDGYYAGRVDDFDGTFQRLRVTPGEHQVDVYLEGYRTLHQKVYLQPDKTFTIKQDLEKLQPGDQPDPRPQPMNPPQTGAPDAGNQPGSQPPMYPPAQRGRRGQPPPPPPSSRDPRDPRDPRAASAFGSIAIRVQPGDADVIVDGEKWRAPEGQERLVIELPEGRHTVEIQKAGFRSYVTDVDVRRGETTPLNVSLRSQNEAAPRAH